VRDRMEQALKGSDADFADIRIERESASRIMFRGRDLDHVGTTTSIGGIARALVRGGWGYATFNNLDRVRSALEEACECARLVGCDKSALAQVEPVVDDVRATMERDFRSVELSAKTSVIEEYNDLILGHHEKIETSNVSYSDSFREVWYANSEGSYLHDERPDVTAYVVAVARDGDNVQMAHDSSGGNAGFVLAEGLHERALAVAQRAVDLLSAPKVQGGEYTVVLDPKLTGVFAHEAFGHLSESDFVYENERMKQLMVLGKRFGPDILNIIDDGSVPGLRGTHKYDDEGVRTRKNHLIEDGILVGRLHSRETAAKMAEQPTGNARAISYLHPPIVRMTNTYIDKGDSTFDEMIKDIKLGLYALDMKGGQTEIEMFTFSAGYGYMIRDGRLAELVRDVVLTGNVFETLANIDMIGNEVEMPPAAGGCGKGAQSPLPVALGGPHVRVRHVVVGGEQS